MLKKPLVLMTVLFLGLIAGLSTEEAIAHEGGYVLIITVYSVKSNAQQPMPTSSIAIEGFTSESTCRKAAEAHSRKLQNGVRMFWSCAQL